MFPSDEIFESRCDISRRSLRVEGVVPDYVRGTCYLNGPGAYVAGDLTRRHWLDGDGMVRKLSFSRDGVAFSARHVVTSKRREEQLAQAALFRSFGTAFPGDTLRKGVNLETPANVSVYPFAGRLLAFGEQSPPWRLDDQTLETLGEETFGGLLGPVTPFSAHPKLDGNGRLANFGIRYMKGRGILSWYEFGPDGELDTRGSVMLGAGNYIHDFALSPHYAVFFLAPYVLDINRFLNEGASLQESLIWDASKDSELLVISRATGRETARINIGREGFSLHSIQALETDQGEIRVDFLTCERPFYNEYLAPMFKTIPPIRVARYRLDPKQGLLSKEMAEPGIHMDFAAFDRYRPAHEITHWWALGMGVEPLDQPKLYDRLVRFDRAAGCIEETYHAATGCYLGAEPIQITNPKDSTQGCVIIQERNYQEKTSAYLVLDAHHLARGPLARLAVDAFDPLGFHSWFVPDQPA